MAKAPTLDDLTSQYSTQSLLNGNFDKIETSFQNTVSRDGSTPNQMEADFDLNNNDLLNVGTTYTSQLKINGVSVSTTNVQTVGYNERADLVLAISNGSLDGLAEGAIVSAAGLDYLKMPAGHALYGTDPISDMPGYAPATVPYMPEHFGAVGDGTTNDGLALKAAAAFGKDVKLTEGRTYLMDGYTIIPTTDGQKFYGGGRLLKTNNVFDAEDASTGGQDAAKFFKINGVNAVKIEDIDIQYTGPVTPRVYGVTVESAARTKINGNRFLGNVTGCFIWKNSDQTEFSGNTSAGGVFCVAMGGDGAGNTDGPVTNTLVVGNIIRNCVGDAIDPNWDCQNMVIRDNILLDNGVSSAEEDIDVGGGVSFGIVVAGNLMDSGGRQKRGITVKHDTKDVVIRDNIIYNCDDSLPDSALIFITGATSTTPPENILIEGNKGSGAYFGVYCLEGPRNVTIKDNTFDVLSEGVRQINPHAILGNAKDYLIESNKIFRTGGLLTSHAVHLQYVDGFRVSGNIVSGGATFGILALSTCSDGIISENLVDTFNVGISCLAPRCAIEGNKVTGCNSHGINLQADHLTCIGNKCWDNSGSGAGARGILLTAGSDFAVITGNQCWDTRGTKLQLGLGITGACDRCIITGNMLYDNLTNIAGTGSLTNPVVADNITT